MKENRNPNIKKQTIKRNYKITLWVQAFFLLLMIILGIVYLFVNKILPFLFASSILFLLFGAYNSYRYLGKKKTPIFYVLAAFLLFLYLLGV